MAATDKPGPGGRVKYVDPPHTHAVIAGRPIRLGKLKPRLDKRTLVLSRYLLDPKTGKKIAVSQLPPLKGSVERSQLVKSYGMMENDKFGNCTCAAVGHALQITSAAATNGKTVHTPPDSAVMDLYWATGDPPNTPCDPGGETDTGRVELDVLNYWRKNPLDGSKIAVYASLGRKTQSELQKMTKYSIDLFGYAYLGLALPISAQSQAIWTPVAGANGVPGSWGGHAVIIVDYDAKGVTCITWGETLKMTWSFLYKYCDESYVAITDDWMNGKGPDSKVSPEGLAIDALMSDMHAIAA